MSKDLWGEEDEIFDDRPEETKLDANGVPLSSPPVQLQRPQAHPRPQPKPDAPPKEPEYDVEEVLEEIEEDFTDVLNDANLRIEQGRLYQLIMNNSLFTDSDADPRAVANVEREIRKFARESMEVMLGMRQTTPVHAELPAVSPFNDLEVEILKKIASKATNGATESPEANVVAEKLKEPRRAPALNPISASTQRKTPVKTPVPAQKPLQKKAAAPIKRTKLDLTIDQIAAEEGVPRELLEENVGLLGSKIDNMSAEEILEHNKIVSQRRRLAKSSDALPMPTYEQQEQMAIQFAGKAAAAPGIAQILEKVKQMPPKG